MVLCAVIGCHKRSGRDNHISFYRIPGIPKKRCFEIQALVKKRKDLWLTRIHREDLNEKQILAARVCSMHFLSGEPADLCDLASPDWAPCINIGQKQQKSASTAAKTEQSSLRSGKPKKECIETLKGDTSGPTIIKVFPSFQKKCNSRKSSLSKTYGRKSYSKAYVASSTSKDSQVSLAKPSKKYNRRKSSTSKTSGRKSHSKVYVASSTSKDSQVSLTKPPRKCNRRKSSTSRISVNTSPLEDEIAPLRSEDVQISPDKLAVRQTFVHVVPIKTENVSSDSQVSPDKPAMHKTSVDLLPFETEGVSSASKDSQVSPEDRLNNIIDQQSEKIKALQQTVRCYEKKIEKLNTLFSDMENLTYLLVSN